MTPKRCSSCGGWLGDHVQVDIASAVIGSVDEKRLTELIANRAWGEARAYQAAHVPNDIRAWRMIRCANGRVGVVARVMPIEVWSDDFYEEPLLLIGNEAEALEVAMRHPAPAPRKRQYLPDPDPDMEPLPPDFNERVLKSVHTRRRRRLWRDAILLAAGVVVVCVVAVLVRRL